MRKTTLLKPLLFTLLLLSNLAVWSQTQKSLIGFHDIPWETKLATVKQKIPHLNVADGCNSFADGKGSEIMRKSNGNCKKLQNNKYKIENTDFELNLLFDSNSGLKEVVLDFSKVFNPSERFKQTECNYAFTNVLNLLRTKYGSETQYTDTQSELPLAFEKYAHWKRSPTDIELLTRGWNYFSHEKKNDLCFVKIVYKPSISAEANKL